MGASSRLALRWIACVCLAAAAFAEGGRATAAPPVNDSFGQPQVLRAADGSFRGATIGATKELGEPAHAGNAGGASVWFVWTPAVTSQIVFTTENSSFDTLLAVYTGDSLTGLAGVAAVDDATGVMTGQVSFPAVAGTTYRIALDGFGGKTGRYEIGWRRAPANDNFADAISLIGESGSVPAPSTGASAEPGELPPFAASVWFRWVAPVTRRMVFFVTSGSVAVYTGTDVASLVSVAPENNGVAFGAAAGTTYLIAVRFSGTGGNLLYGRPPANDLFARAQGIRGRSGRVVGNNVGARRQSREPLSGPSIWYRWRAPATGTALFSTAGSSFDTTLWAFSGPRLGALRRLASNDDRPGADTLTSLIRFPVTRGRVYRIAVSGFDNEVGRVVMSWSVRSP
jgi:hypothetical protein